MPISLVKEKESIILQYAPRNGIDWIKDKFSNGEKLLIYSTFEVAEDNLVSQSEIGIPYMNFIIANLEQIDGGKLYHISKDTLRISFDVYISEECDVTEKWFTCVRRTSIFRLIDSFWGHDKLFIGESGDFAVSEREFKKLIQSLQNNTELDNYVRARVCSTMKNIVPVKKDLVTPFQKYLNKKSLHFDELRELDFEDFDVQRYVHLRSKLESMLSEQNSYSEADWQKLIMKFIQILFPKYVFVEQHPEIDTPSRHKRIPDIILGDADGHVDIIEIKKPFSNGMITAKKSNLYRDNYIPLRELSGAIMQCEKYIYFMTAEGKNAEEKLNNQFKPVLPSNYSLKIINPKAMIIMGRSNEFEAQQEEDFEIIKRKYKNIIDIITYDDLLRRLVTTISILQEKQEQSLQL